MAKMIELADLIRAKCSGVNNPMEYSLLRFASAEKVSNICVKCRYYNNGNCLDYISLTGQVVDDFCFDVLIDGKRKEELSAIFTEIQNISDFSEEVICRYIDSVTRENGRSKKGHKLWMRLKSMYPGGTYSVDPEAIALAILENDLEESA